MESTTPDVLMMHGSVFMKAILQGRPTDAAVAASTSEPEQDRASILSKDADKRADLTEESDAHIYGHIDEKIPNKCSISSITSIQKIKTLDEPGVETTARFYHEFNSKRFQQDSLMQLVEECYLKNSRFHIKIPKEIKYIARKYDLPEGTLPLIYESLLAGNIDNEAKRYLALALRYSLAKRKDVFLSQEEFLNLLSKNNNDNVKSEVVRIFAYGLANIHQQGVQLGLNEELIRKEINKIKTENSHSTESVNFLEQQLSKLNQQFDNTTKIKESISRKSKIAAVNGGKNRNSFVTKTQQTNKSKHQKSQEEISTEKMDLMGLLKSQKKNISHSVVLESVPQINDDEKGSDRGWFSTYKDVKILYLQIQAGKSIKDEDKDNYLHLRFLQPDKKWYNDPLKGLFVDRMISDILLSLVTGKGLASAQKLNNACKDLLMKCLDGRERVVKEILGTANDKEICELTICKDIVYQKYKDEPKIIKDTANELYQAMIIGQTQGSVNNQLYDSEVDKPTLCTLFSLPQTPSRIHSLKFI
jgi:hypothetical protein